MKHQANVFVRFYAGLNDFLPCSRRHRTFIHVLEQRTSVKDLIESIGVPHPEVDLIIVGDRSVAFSHQPQPGDRIAAYPRFRALDVGVVSLVRPPALDQLRFVLDAHLGRLTAYLRLTGLDCLYSNIWRDDRLAAASSAEKRVLLSRDVALLKRTVVTYGYWVRQIDPRRQLGEIAARFDLRPHARPFSRCAHCNTPLVVISKEVVVDRLPPRTREHYQEFHHCPDCKRIYWKGGHYQRVHRLIEEVLDSSQ